jgi:hypothetical protein
LAFAVPGVAVELPAAAAFASVAPLVLVSACFTPFAVDGVASLDVLAAAAIMWNEIKVTKSVPFAVPAE